jgi:acid phosphatase (class A)
VLEAQRHLTPADVASVRVDMELSVFRFADTMGPAFKPENLPSATQLAR